ncbi:MAG: ornithine carbamoyltransferase, partial [Thermodesulfobacteria bacterium]|nr:ornithine carbamoyltransferase [Thermodesulfobacteriota bacterium]
MRHLTRVFDLSSEEIKVLLERALRLKENFKFGRPRRTLVGKVLALLFEKPSTRTRV